MTGESDLEYRTFLAATLEDCQFVGVVDEKISAALFLTVRAVRADTAEKAECHRRAANQALTSWATERGLQAPPPTN